MFQRRDLLQRDSKRDKVARIAAAGTQSAQRAFQIAHIRKLLAKGVEAEGIFEERLNRILPVADRLDGGERLRKPLAQQPRAHRRGGFIEHAVKRGVARRVVVQRLENFQMPQRRVIEREKIAALVKRNPREVLHVAAQILREIMQRAARRADGGGFVLQPETVQRGDFEMFPHGEHRRFRRKCPVVVAAQDFERIRAANRAATPPRPGK